MASFSSAFEPTSPPEGVQSLQQSVPRLLPPFEPFSSPSRCSSSPFPRPQSSKRKLAQVSPNAHKEPVKFYPTPVPTSSTGVQPSSPEKGNRPSFQRTISMLSERRPLGAVPTVDLPADGEIVRMGRSSNSSDYQLSANRLISRTHIQAAYHAPTASCPDGYIEVECLGWNGAKIHCKGLVFDLAKGDTYISENPDAELMLDVQDTRVMIAWPFLSQKLSWDSDDEHTPNQTSRNTFASSPPIVPRSPVSQSPIRQPVFDPAIPHQSSTVQIFEDADVAEESTNSTPLAPADPTAIHPVCSSSSPAASVLEIDAKASVIPKADDFSDEDEENDPVIHSFGPFGENLLPRLASFSTATQTQSNVSARQRCALVGSSLPVAPSTQSRFKNSPIKNHVINQLAYSRVHSQPLSTIHCNLPADLKTCVERSSGGQADNKSNGLTKNDLKQILDDLPCIGEIPRQGKDAAGRPLENEFYYLPEMDADQIRRETVTLNQTGLRAVRRSHKQYYWKRPRV